MLLSIVTINFKTPELTIACIDSLQEQFSQEFKNATMEHIIVDNNSQDDSVMLLEDHIKKRKYNGIYVITSGENLGFGNGNNLGTTYAKGTYILFLNSDTQIADRGFLQMVTWLDDHMSVAILGGKMKNADGSVQLSAWKFYTLHNLMLMLLGAERFGLLRKAPKTIEKVDWVTGGCMMIRKKDFEKIGKFDKHIFMYMEDMELCFRAKKEGFATYYYPFVEVFHKSHGSSNRSFAILSIYKGILYFYKKHMPLWQYGIAIFLLKLKALILFIIGKVSKNSYLITTYGQALTIS